VWCGGLVFNPRVLFRFIGATPDRLGRGAANISAIRISDVREDLFDTKNVVSSVPDRPNSELDSERDPERDKADSAFNYNRVFWRVAAAI